MNHFPPCETVAFFPLKNGYQAKKKGAAKGGTERDPNEMRTRWRTRSESPLAERNIFEQCKEGPVITEDMAAIGHTMETVASKCLC